MPDPPVSSIRRHVPLVAVAGLVGAVAVAGCWRSQQQKRFEATSRCAASTAQLDYDPEGRVEVRAGGELVAWADGNARNLEFTACERSATQTEFSVCVPYTSGTKRVTLTCRLPGRFLVHVHPVFSSAGGEW